MRKRTALIFLCLTLLGMLAQVVPFLLYPLPSARQVAVMTLPQHYPPGYTATDYAKAQAFHQAFFWGDLLNTLTTVFGLCALLFSGLPERFGAVSSPKPRAWLARISFLVAVYLALFATDGSFNYACFHQLKSFGLSSLTVPAWVKLRLLASVVPLMFFVLKYLFVTCTLPLCQRQWWWVAVLGIFLINSVIPEFLSRDRPINLVENLQPLTSGPHYDAMQTVLRKTGSDLPIFVVDESRRSKTSNIWLTGRKGREYVLVTDTFLQFYPPPQVAIALAHELGHFQLRLTSLVLRKSFGLLLLLLSFGLAFLCAGRQAVPVSLMPRLVLVIMLCSSLVSFALAPISLALSRAEERHADHYALQLTGNPTDFRRLLLKLAQQQFVPLDLPRWQYYLCANHPTFLERAAPLRDP